MSQLTINNFVDLPVQVSCNILSAWLTARDIGRFDLACCKADLRDFLFKTWSSEQYVMEEIPAEVLKDEDTANAFLEWATIRCVKVKKLHIFDWSNIVLYERFVSSAGETITYIELDGDVDELWAHYHVIATYCVNLKVLKVSNCKLNASLAVVLKKCPSLTELELNKCTGLSGIKFPKAACPVLKLVEMELCDCDEACLESLLSTTTALRGLRLKQSAHISGAYIANSVSRCPHLIHLSIACTKISDTELQQLAQGCPGMQRVDVGYCTRVTDAGILALVTHCTALHALLMPSIRCTDVTVHSIVEHCPSIAEVDTSGCDGISTAGKRRLLQSCQRLKKLCLSGCTTELLKLLPSSVTDLMLYHTVLTDEMLAMISSRCKNLTDFNCTFKCELLNSAEGLAEFIFRSAKLNLLELPVELPELAVSIWKRWRPNMTIVCDTDRWGINVMVDDGL